MSIDAMTAMGQASSTASEYFDAAAKDIERLYPKASDDTKCQAAATLAIAASLDYLAAAASGLVRETPLKKALENLADSDFNG